MSQARSPVGSTASGPRPVAVIDIGSTSIRMAVAEIQPTGEVRMLEALSQAVNLGKDTFTHGGIDKGTIEECVRVLKSYRRVLREYSITQSDQIRVVATSAVREATNRLSFIDRVYIATGLEVEPIDEVEVNRVTYLGLLPYFRSDKNLYESQSVIIEVGGGSTEMLVLREGNVVYSHTYRLGSLRLRRTLEAYRAPTFKVRNIMESQILRTVSEAKQHLPPPGAAALVALGGDMRFAAGQLVADWDQSRLGRVPLPVLRTFTEKILAFTVDELMQKYHLSFPEAETLGPALLAYLRLAEAFELKEVLVTRFNLRNALLSEMATQTAWSEEFRNQIVRSAIDLGARFGFDEAHARHVAKLSALLFQGLTEEHQLDPRYEVLLQVASLLHEIGLFVSNRSYHKHTMYLIANSELFGVGKVDKLIVSQIARYHRRASPQPTHEGYALLTRENRVTVAKLAALLRVAKALDESRGQRIHELQLAVDAGQLVISIPNVDDLTLEQLALKQGGTLFEETFGLQVLLRPVR